MKSFFLTDENLIKFFNFFSILDQCESLRYKLMGGLAVRRAAYGVLRFIMESGAKVYSPSTFLTDGLIFFFSTGLCLSQYYPDTINRSNISGSVSFFIRFRFSQYFSF